METSEIMFLIQSFILVITAIIIYLYTRETSKIRKATERHNTLIAQQLQLMQERNNFETRQEISFVEPIFKYENAIHGKTKSKSNFINVGGLIKDISIVALDNFIAKIEPKSVLRPNERGKIYFSHYPTPPKDKLRFEIHYKNQLGLRGRQTFYIVPGEGKFHLEEIWKGGEIPGQNI